MKPNWIVAALVACVATGAVAQDQQPEPEKAEKKICKTQRITGSLTRRSRTCMTQAEWDRVAQGTRNAVDNVIRDANQSQAAGGAVMSDSY